MLELHQFRHSAFCLKVRMVLQAKGLSYREGSQKPGDVVFIPPSTIFTSLTYADAASVRGTLGTAGDTLCGIYTQ